MEKNVVKINESRLQGIIRNSIMEALKFQRSINPANPKGNVGPKDENLNFFVTVGTGSNRQIVGDKGFKTREAAERKAQSLRDQGRDNVRIISRKATNESVKLNESALRKIIAESVERIMEGDYPYYDSDAPYMPDFRLSDERPMRTDRVTPGDSLPMPKDLGNFNRFKDWTNLEKLRLSIRNQIENKENMTERYSLKDLANDIAYRYKMSPAKVFDIAKTIYKKLGAYRAVDM